MAIGLVCFIIPAVSYDGPCLIYGGPSPFKWSPMHSVSVMSRSSTHNTVQGKGRHNYNDSVSIVRRFDSPKIQLKLKLALTLTLTLTDTGDLRTIEQTPLQQPPRPAHCPVCSNTSVILNIVDQGPKWTLSVTVLMPTAPTIQCGMLLSGYGGVGRVFRLVSRPTA